MHTCVEPNYSNKNWIMINLHVKKIKILLKSFDLQKYYHTFVTEDWLIWWICGLHVLRAWPCSLIHAHWDSSSYTVFIHTHFNSNLCFKSTYSFCCKDCTVSCLISAINVPMASLTLACTYKCMQTAHTDPACIILLCLFLRSTCALIKHKTESYTHTHTHTHTHTVPRVMGMSQSHMAYFTYLQSWWQKILLGWLKHLKEKRDVQSVQENN